jgi:hypothetical protein
MNAKNDKSVQPRRTSTKEASERNAPQPVVQQQEQAILIDVMPILADPHPMNGEDYALQLFYKSKENHRNLNIQCTHKSLNQDNETATLVVNQKRYEVNIRTGIISLLGNA